MKTLRVARPALLDALPERGHAVIEASAGTGKTYTLEHLVVELLVRGAPLDQILVVTFTEKATREMRARVRATLGAIVTRRRRDAHGAFPTRVIVMFATGVRHLRSARRVVR